MKPIWQILQPNQLGTTLDDVKSALGGFTTKMAQDLQRILSNGATVKDNLAMTYIEFDAIHATEMQVSNPFKSVPQAFIPISAFTLVGGVGGRNNGVQLQMSGQPILNLSRTDGYLGITVQYALPLGDISISNFSTAATQTTTVDRSAATLTLNPGSWVLSANCGLAGTPTGFTLGLMSIFTAATNGGSDANGARVWSSVAPNGNSDTSLCIAALPVSLTAATPYFAVLRANFTGGSVSGYGRLSALRVAPDPATTARVRGILVEA